MINWLKNNIFKITLFFFLIFLSVFIFKYLVTTKPIPQVKQKKESLLNVNIVKTTIENVTPYLDAYGKVKSKRYGTLSFGVSGKIEFLSDNFLDGSIVKKGEVLARLDKTKYILEVQRLSSDLVELKKQLKIRSKQLNRNKEMLNKNVISSSKYDDELIKISQNRLDLNRTKINLEQAKKDLKDTILKPKFDGLISNVNVTLGQFISKAQVISKIDSLDNPEVEFIVPASIYVDAKKLIGKDISVIWESGGKELIKLNARIVRNEGITREKDGGGKIYATLENDIDKTIPVGSFVKIKYPFKSYKSVIKLPESAIFENKFIFIVNEGVAKRLSIDLVYKGPGFVLIDKKNIENKSVIINRFSVDIDGRKLKIF